MGRLIGATTQYSFLPGSPFTNAYTYDAASNRKSLTAPDSSITTYGYDTLNRVNGMANSWAGSFRFSYDALNRRTQLTRPNGINTNYGYDSVSRLLSVLHQSGSTTLDGASYTYDSAGNRQSKTNQRTSVTEGYTYDLIYQLTQVTQGLSTTESYGYDPVGNRLSSSGVPTYDYNSSNELTSTSTGSFTYDANGNTLTDPSGKQYTWDFENRLIQAVVPGTGTTTFKYDPFGRRTQKSGPNGTTTYLYEGLGLVTELDSSGNITARYTQAGENIDEPLAMSRSGAASYYQADGIGSIVSLSNSIASIVSTYTYDSFGRSIASTGTLFNPFRYTAREFDPETAFYFYRSRYYDPSSGRFISEDTIRFRGGEDFYAYVGNSPANLTDPMGMAGIPGVCPSQPLANGGFQYYGNWGGPGWTGGQTVPYEDLTPEQQSHLPRGIDAQDSCYKAHDLCYSRARVNNKCTSSDKPDWFDKLREQRSEATCDDQLAQCLKNVPKNGHSVCSSILFPLRSFWLYSTGGFVSDLVPENPAPYKPYQGWGSVDNK